MKLAPRPRDGRTAIDAGYLSCARAIVVAGGFAQTLFWLYVSFALPIGHCPFDLVFVWLVTPATALGVAGFSIPLAAGLATAGFVTNAGLVALLGQA